MCPIPAAVPAGKPASGRPAPVICNHKARARSVPDGMASGGGGAAGARVWGAAAASGGRDVRGDAVGVACSAVSPDFLAPLMARWGVGTVKAVSDRSEYSPIELASLLAVDMCASAHADVKVSRS